MERYCLARLNMQRVIVSICPLFAILIHTGWAVGQSPTAQVAAASPIEGVAGLLGKPAPPFVVVTLDGKQVSLDDYKGKTLLVNFWATWCAACKEEMPWLAELREKYVRQGFEIIGIVTDGATDEKVRQIATKYGVEYRIARCNHKTAQAYGGLPYLPESFYINKRGKVVLTSADSGSKEQIEANIRKLLGLGSK